MMLMNLVWGRAGSNVPLDLVWQAILGVTDQYQRAHLSDEYYGEVCAHLRVSGYFTKAQTHCIIQYHHYQEGRAESVSVSVSVSVV